MNASRYEVFGATDPGCVRSNNEDAYLIDEAQGLYLLADGMGGARAGERASRLAVDTVASQVRAGKADLAGAQNGLLEKSFEVANAAVLQAAAGDDALRGMGTTLLGLLDCGNALSVACVGDSRCYVLEQGTLKQVTEDQSWANEIGRHLGIEAAAMRTHPMRHVLTMAIGADVSLRVQTHSLNPSEGTEILLSSDGLHGVVSAEKIEAALNSGKSLEAKCHYLIDEARKAGGPDNITVVLLRKKPER
jgi:protein phosphatase